MLDRTRENFGWIGARAEELTDPDYDALYFAVAGNGTNGGAFAAELVAGRTIAATATCSSAQSFAYGTSIACTGTQYLGVSVPAVGLEDFGFRFRVRPSAHTGVRDVARFDNDALVVQLNASNQWNVNDGTLRTQTAVAAVNGTWVEAAVEREGLTMVLKVNGAVVLSWASTLDLAATDWRVGTDNANGCDCHFNDVRAYLAGHVSPHTPSRRGYRSQFRRSIIGVGRL
ncbi:hypothetical protein [Azospirillum sp. sgz301742]